MTKSGKKLLLALMLVAATSMTLALMSGSVKIGWQAIPGTGLDGRIFFADQTAPASGLKAGCL